MGTGPARHRRDHPRLRGGDHGLSAIEIRAVAEIIGERCDEDLLWRIRVLEGSYGKEVNRKAGATK